MDPAIKQKSHVCNTCAKVFLHHSSLMRHMLSHSNEKPFKCKSCDKSYTRPDKLRKHEKTHHSDTTPDEKQVEGRVEASKKEAFHNGKAYLDRPPMEITPIDTSYVTLTSYEGTSQASMTLIDTSHVNDIDKDSGHICAECQKQFPSSTALHEHMKLHLEKETYVCPACQKGFCDYMEFCQHMAIHFSEKQVTCVYCDKDFSNTSELNEHIQIHTNRNQTALQPITSQENETTRQTPHPLHVKNTTQIEETQSIHPIHIPSNDQARIHTISTADSNDGTPGHQAPYAVPAYRTQVEGVLQAASHGSIETSVSETSISTDKPMDDYVCPHCQVGFILAADLKTHISSQHKQGCYVCRDCKEEFTDSAALQQHDCTKSKERVYVCPYYEAGFAQGSKLKEHLRSHTREKTEVCPHCEEVLFDQSTLEEHVKQHLKDHMKQSLSVKSGLNTPNSSDISVKSLKSTDSPNNDIKSSPIHQDAKIPISLQQTDFKTIEILDSNEEPDSGTQISVINNNSDGTSGNTSLHRKEVKGPSVCNQCGKQFSSAVALYRHLLSHVKNKGTVLSPNTLAQSQPKIGNKALQSTLGEPQQNNGNIVSYQEPQSNTGSMLLTQAVVQPQLKIDDVVSSLQTWSPKQNSTSSQYSLSLHTLGQTQPNKGNSPMTQHPQPSNGTVLLAPFQILVQPQPTSTHVLPSQTLEQPQMSSGYVLLSQTGAQPHQNLLNVFSPQTVVNTQLYNSFQFPSQNIVPPQLNNVSFLTTPETTNPQPVPAAQNSSEGLHSKSYVVPPQLNNVSFLTTPDTTNPQPVPAAQNSSEGLHSKSYVLKCPMCTYTFIEKSDLRLHVFSSHAVDTNLSCLMCAISYATKRSTTRHMKLKHNGQSPHTCPFCMLVLRDSSSLWEHICRHWVKVSSLDSSGRTNCEFENRETPNHSESTHVCRECGKGFKRAVHLSIHMRTHSKKKNMNEVENPEKPNRTEKDQIHGKPELKDGHGESSIPEKTANQISMTAEQSNAYVCKECGKGFKQAGHLCGHMKTHNKKKNIYRVENPEKPNHTEKDQIHGKPELKDGHGESSIPEKTANQISMTAEQSNAYVCKECGKGFKQAGHLSGHLKTHGKNENMNRFCKDCGNELSQVYKHVCKNRLMDSFSISKVSLKNDGTKIELLEKLYYRMTKLHSGESDYAKCVVCVQGFTSCHDLRDHLTMHRLLEKS